jgi:hypothetical protein
MHNCGSMTHGDFETCLVLCDVTLQHDSLPLWRTMDRVEKGRRIDRRWWFSKGSRGRETLSQAPPVLVSSSSLHIALQDVPNIIISRIIIVCGEARKQPALVIHES